jgi:DNA-binding NarL/FixJ family response regulator
MFKKVLIADDLASINKGVKTITDNLKIKNAQLDQYCDTVYLKIKKAQLNNDPFELLITDLSFMPDHREETFKSGEELIQALKKEHPSLIIIVYSVEDRIQKVRQLLTEHNINGYVCKGRRGLIELEAAIQSVFNGQTYVSPQVSNALKLNRDQEISSFDIELIKQVSLGLTHIEISDLFKQNSISPNGLSSLEKRLNRLKDQFQASNIIHLVSIVKDLGLI